MAQENILKVGQPVNWRGSWGKDASVVAVVTGIEKTKNPNEKNGKEVKEVNWSDNFVVDLDNGHWAYSHQVSQIN